MVVAAILVLLLAAAFFSVVVWAFLATRPPAAGVEGFAPPEGLTPMDAGVLLNLPRRGPGANALGLVLRGALLVDQEGGPGRHRLFHGTEERGSRTAMLAETLLGYGRNAREHRDLYEGDDELRRELQSCISTTAHGLRVRGLLRVLSIRLVLDRCGWAVGALALATALAGTSGPAASIVACALGSVSVGLVVGGLLLRRRVGWLRTAEGNAVAASLMAFRARLIADRTVRRRYPEWAVLCSVPLDEPVIARGVILDAEWIEGLVTRLDPGGTADTSADTGE